MRNTSMILNSFTSDSYRKLENKKFGIRLTIIILSLILWIFGNAYAQSQQPNQNTDAKNGKLPTSIPFRSHNTLEKNNQKDAKPIIKSTTPKADKEQNDNWISTKNNNIFKSLTHSDLIAIIASIVAFLQFIALIWTVRVMINNGRRQLRAYVFVDIATIMDGSQLKIKPPVDCTSQPGVYLTIKNSGQTPAYALLHWAQIAIEDINNEHHLIPPKQLNNFSATHLGSNGIVSKFLWLGRMLTDPEIEGIKQQTKAVFIYGKITYKDAFNKIHTTLYRLKYNGIYPPVDGAIFTICDNGNEAD